MSLKSNAEYDRKGGKWFCYQLVAAGQHTECTAAATDSPTPLSPPPRCKRLCGGSDTLYNAVVPASLMIEISLAYDRT